MQLPSALVLAATAGALGTAGPASAASTSLSQEGFGKRDENRISALARAYPEVGVRRLLRHLDRRIQANQAIDPCRRGGEKPKQYPLTGVAVASAYRFDCTDDRTEEWTPQGLTGADQSQLKRPEIQAISWYRGTSGKETDVRVTFVNRTSGRYRHALLVVPAGGRRFSRVTIHAGGIAWVGRYLYVADTGQGLRVFDTQRILSVPERKRPATRNAAYLLPQIGSYQREPGNTQVFSSVSYAASVARPAGPAELPRLVVGQYRAKGKGPGSVASYPLDGALLQGTRPYGTPATGFPEMQGVLALPGSPALIGSTSDGTQGKGGATLYVRDATGGHTYPWGLHPEDLYFESARREIWSLTEFPRQRLVFSARAASFGL